MVLEADIVDNVPTVGWVWLPKRLVLVFCHEVGRGKGIVDEYVQLAFLFRLDGFKKILDFIVVRMINWKIKCKVMGMLPLMVTVSKLYLEH